MTQRLPAPTMRNMPLKPALGNHEYQTAGASGYFDYFRGLGVPTGARGEGWYSFDIGTWHLVALNRDLQRLAAATTRRRPTA